MADNWLFEAAHVKLADWMAPFADDVLRPDLAACAGAADRRRAQPRTPHRVGGASGHCAWMQDPHFTNYHRVLNRCRWSSRRVARCLFGLLVNTFDPERAGHHRPGRHAGTTLGRQDLAARGIYRDPTRSSHGHFVKASGLRWLSVMILPEIAFAGRVWGLPFLTALAPSERYAMQRQRRHKKLTDWGRQVLLQTARWLPGRQIDWRGRQQLRLDRLAQCGAQPPLHDHPPAPRRSPVRSTGSASSWHDWVGPPRHRSAPGKSGRTPG